MADTYILRVTAGPSYDAKTHKLVHVNASTPLSIESDLADVDLNVRIQGYRGLPKSSPETSPYFTLPRHAKNNDQYSITFRFKLKQDINGNDLVFGNDFDNPIRDRLPPGFSTALKIVKWAIDPGLDGDPYADKPYLYGPMGSSVNVLHVGSKEGELSAATAGESGEDGPGLVFEEGGDEEGLSLRQERDVPDSEAARKKFFLNETNRKGWEWEARRVYGCDFFNAYLDFNEFALRLPGFTLPIIKYWDGKGLESEVKRSHTLRYVLKDRATGQVLFVVVFTLHLPSEIDDEGNVKPGAAASAKTSAPASRAASVTNGSTSHVDEDDVD